MDWDDKDFVAVERSLGENRPETPIDQYSNQFPNELRKAVKGLDGDLEFAIVYLLIEEGALPFSKLKDKLDIHQQSLTNALDGLQTGAIINRREVGDLEEPYEVYYSLSSFGDRFIEKLIESLGSGEGEIVLEEDYIKDPWIDGLLFQDFAGFTVRKKPENQVGGTAIKTSGGNIELVQ